MVEDIKNYFSPERLKRLSDVRNIGVYVFALVVLAITWSGIKTIQTNYGLQKKISELKQQNAVLKLQNDNAALENRYLETDPFLDLAARQDLGLAAPGEQVMLVPKSVALKYVDPNLAKSSSSAAAAAVKKSKYMKNFEDWRNFLLGRQLFEE